MYILHMSTGKEKTPEIPLSKQSKEYEEKTPATTISTLSTNQENQKALEEALPKEQNNISPKTRTTPQEY